MNQDVKDFTVQKVKEFMSVPYCCAEAKEAGQAFLDALGTEQEAEKAKALIAELELDIMPVDQLIGFAKSEAGAQVFGAENAKNVAAHGEEIKAAQSTATARHVRRWRRFLRGKTRFWDRKH